ncbi:MAG: hypothetical protein R6U96_08495 [Promethearchaeia archaeon]
MWTKIPWKDEYVPFVNLFCEETDGYHGLYWVARYQESMFNILGDAAVIISARIIQILQILYSLNGFSSVTLNPFYIASVVYLLLMLLLSKDELSEKFLKDPPEGRYNDYRVDPKYINALNEADKRRHLEKYGDLLEEIQ